jgi:hypothetical protein
MPTSCHRSSSSSWDRQDSIGSAFGDVLDVLMHDIDPKLIKRYDLDSGTAAGSVPLAQNPTYRPHASLAATAAGPLLPPVRKGIRRLSRSA